MLSPKEKSELVINSSILFSLTEISMRFVTLIRDISLQNELRAIFEPYWKMTTKFSKLVRKSILEIEQSKGEELENFFDADCDKLAEEFLELINKIYKNEKTS